MEHAKGFRGDKVLIWSERSHQSVWLIMFLPVLFSRSVFYLTIKHLRRLEGEFGALSTKIETQNLIW